MYYYFANKFYCHSGLSGIVLNSSEGFPARFACGNDNFIVFNGRSDKEKCRPKSRKPYSHIVLKKIYSNGDSLK